MARLDISEFSYGYALTEHLAWFHRHQLRAAPIFPSLVDEGKSGWGWDMKLEVEGIPIFLQFKLGTPIVRRNTIECKALAWTPPFYRMHLRATRHSYQHESLVGLEAQGHIVYYVAPVFHEAVALDEAYRTRRVAASSYWLRPSLITLPSDGEHHVSYVSPQGPHCVCSKTPQAFEANATFDAFISRVTSRLRGGVPVRLEQQLETLANDLDLAIVRRAERARVRLRHRNSARFGTSWILGRGRPISRGRSLTPSWWR